MKKNKTTKSSKKSYNSVKEVLEDNNSKIKLTPLNCKEAKFGKIITMSNPHSISGKFDVIFRRADASKTFFNGIENQISNQILWNEEEQQAYFLNPDKQLYKILFEPIDMKSVNKTYIKRDIENLAITRNNFCCEEFNNRRIFNTHLLKPLFIDLLDLVKEKKIKVKCGVGMMQIINETFVMVDSTPRTYEIASCEFIPELDFNLPKFDMWYEDVCLVGTPEDKDVTNSECLLNFQHAKEVAEKILYPTNKKKSLWERIFG